MPELQDVVAAFDKIESEINTFKAKSEAELKETGKVATDTKAALDGLADRLLGLEQKMASRHSGLINTETKSVGQQVIESEGFKAFAAGNADKTRIEIKAATLTSATSDSAGSVGAAIVPHRVPGIVTPPERAMTIRDVISQATTSSNSIQYVREKAFNNAAAPVAENPQESKPQSDISFELEDAPVRTLAHVFHISKQALDDVPQMAAYINSRGLYGLRFVEEQQILNGPGTGQNLLGIFPQAAAYKESTLGSLAEARQMADDIRLAILQAREAEYRATAIVLNPVDWAAIELLKTTGVSSSGEYLWSNPREMAQPRLWGLPVIETQAIPAGNFLVGDFKNAATVWDRQQPTVELSQHHGTNFVENLVTIRVESRLALTVYRPSAMVKGDFYGSPTLNA